MRLRYQEGFVQLIAKGSVFIQREGVSKRYQCLQLDDSSLVTAISTGRICCSTEQYLRQTARQLVSGVDRMHSLGVVRRNIEPSNLLLGADGALHFAGFDLAKLCDPRAVQDKAMWQPVGSYTYMSPDMLTGGSCSCIVDEWAVGATLLDLASELQMGQLCDSTSERGQHRAKRYLDQFVNCKAQCCEGKLAAQLTDPHCFAGMRDFVAACCGLGPYDNKPQAASQLMQHHWLQG